MGEPVQAVEDIKVERWRIIENTAIFSTDKQPPVNLEVSAASVQIPCTRLQVRPGRASRVKQQGTRARQQERRPTLVRKPVYVRREDVIGIGVKAHWAVAHVICLCASRVAIANLNAAMLPEKEPITSQYAAIQACALLHARSSGALDDRQEAFNGNLVLIGRFWQSATTNLCFNDIIQISCQLDFAICQ